ncbi:hypothetical protein [Mycolicibacterium goodii]|uniref:Uncharacterized protein n=1 Tax=Mycolicibacterium goodii TaxID=134601 RepID=A0A0K0WZT0_MYCGD|nr:hypothetical protein AFA91_00495 [Mycolicibacterium goodii]
MSATVVVVIAAVSLGAWRLQVRRHPNWATSDDARFHISAGTWTTLIALYWFLQSRQEPHWVWDAWPIVVVAAALLLLRGLNELDATRDEEFVPTPPRGVRSEARSNFLRSGAHRP